MHSSCPWRPHLWKQNLVQTGSHLPSLILALRDAAKIRQEFIYVQMGSLEKNIADSPEQSNDMETDDLIMRDLVRLSIFGEEHFVQTVGLSSPCVYYVQKLSYPATEWSRQRGTSVILRWSNSSVSYKACFWGKGFQLAIKR